jgi:hypothetical protein
MLHEQFEQENVANSIGMTGSKSKMLQIAMKTGRKNKSNKKIPKRN